VALLAASCAPSPVIEEQTPPPTPSVSAAPSASPLGIYDRTRPGDLRPELRDIPSRVYVPNSKSDTVDVIDPDTMAVVDHFSVGALPQHVTPSWDMSTLYVDNDKANTLTPIDPKTGKPGSSFRVVDPYNLYFTPTGELAVVVAERFRRIDFLDPRTWDVVGSVDIGRKGPNHLDFSADGRYLLISCEFSGYVVKVDVERMEVVSSLRVGGKPTDVRLSPDGSVFFVANENLAGVTVVDPSEMREVQFIPTGPGAHGFVVSRDGTKLYVTNRAGGSVSVLDMATRRVVESWRTGGSPDMGGVSTDGTRLWLSARYHSYVFVIDTRTGEVLKRIPVGREPHGLCVFPQPGRYSLGHTGNYR
jgi:YVTN family beta-propeller protein